MKILEVDSIPRLLAKATYIDEEHRKIYVSGKNCPIKIEINFNAFIKLLSHSYKVLDRPITSQSKKEPLFIFEDCVFEAGFKLSTDNKYNIEFFNCQFKEIFYLKNTKFSGKWKFRGCKFWNTDFSNTGFEDLADFYRCDFYNKVIFFKTDFLGTTVFSGSTFHQNVLFTYSLIEKLIIFRGTTFKKGLDLSLSIGQGEINCFGMHLDNDNYDVVKRLVGHNYTEEEYDNDVSTDGKIPIKNKRETFRILKHTLVSQNNISESIKFKVLEKSTLRSELALTPASWQNTFDQLNLWLNWNSNNYGNSYWQAIKFVAVVGLICFYPAALCSDKYSMGIPDCSTLEAGIGDFFKFLLPTHSVDYLDGDNLAKAYFPFFIFDFIGRVFVGYGIYQFIQAFRKYR